MSLFVGARCAYCHAGVARAGVVTSITGSKARFKLDNLSLINVELDKLELLNYWKTAKLPRDVDEFSFYPKATTALSIFKSKKAIVFGQAAIRSVWYWANAVVFDGRMVEPNFLTSTSRTNFGTWLTSTRTLTISTRCHSFLEFTSTVVHEMIHQCNREIEHSDYASEGAHGASFLRWVPIVKAKTGLNVQVNAFTSDDVAEHGADTIAVEEKTSQFVFLLFKTDKVWYGLQTDKDNLPGLYGSVSALVSSNGWDEKIYAGRSDFLRVKRELITTKHGALPRLLKLPFSPSLVNLLAQTCTPITGYRVPVAQKL